MEPYNGTLQAFETADTQVAKKCDCGVDNMGLCNMGLWMM